MNNYAAKWAKNMASKEKLYHSNGKYGENVYVTYDVKTSDSDAVKDATAAWFNEYKDYRFNNLFSSATGHFTQVVWKDTKYLGIAVARSPKAVYVCANYDPKGNVMRQFLQNVLRP